MPCCKHKLNSLPAGCKARIKGHCDDPKLRGRLCALGLTPGTVAEVCAPCSFRVKGCLLTLGEDIACNLECEPLADDNVMNVAPAAGTI